MVQEPKFKPYDGILRWAIESRTSSHKTYIVDLGLEECQCIFHQCEVGPKLKKGLPTKRCQHYYMAKGRFADWAVWAFHKDDPNRKHDDTI